MKAQKTATGDQKSFNLCEADIYCLKTLLIDSLYFGVNENVAVTTSMQHLNKTHPFILRDIAHLYDLDEKNYDNILAYTFIGARWKCEIGEVEKRIKQLISVKPIMVTIESYILRLDREKGFGIKYSSEFLQDVKWYINESQKIMVMFDLFIEFVINNLY
jgi:hypothetical protein